MSRKILNANLTVRHIYMAYARDMLERHPGWKGTTHNKIENFYLYDSGGRQVMTYTLFRKVVETFFTQAKQRIIFKGEAVHINECGKILAKRVERDHRKRRINWDKTRREPLYWNEEKQKHCYQRVIVYTDDDWCRIAWLKNRIHNNSFYTFEPTSESSTSQPTMTPGFIREFVEAQNNNPLLKFRYLYEPLTLSKRAKKTKTTEDGIPDYEPAGSDRAGHPQHESE